MAFLTAFVAFPWALLIAEGCKTRLANSKLPGVGQGVFAGRYFKEGVTIARTREMLIRREVVEHTPLWNYAFHLRQGKVMSVLLGAASMLNHGEAEMVNVRFSRESESIIKVVANRDIEEGEELFTSYGSEDWFLDRHIPYKKPEDIHNLRFPTGSPSVCLDTLVPDALSESIVAENSMSAGDVIHSPFFLMPQWLSRWLSQKGEDGEVMVMSYCFGHPAWDVMLLPFLLPGSLANDQEAVAKDANVIYSVNFDADLAKLQIHNAVNTYKSFGTFQVKALRDILPGEKLIAGNVDLTLPGHWESVNIWQSQISAAEAAEVEGADSVESAFKVAEAFRLGLQGAKSLWIRWPHADSDSLSTALAWYRRAAKQGHLEATFRAGALIHDLLTFRENNTSEEATSEASSISLAIEAADWYSRASIRGHVRAQLLLAEMNIDGKFLPKNLSAAAFWGRKALASGASRISAFCETFYEIAVAFQEVGQRDAEFFWLQVAAEAGSPNAQYTLGQGLGDTPEAMSLLHQAATQGHVDAAFALGVAFLHQNMSLAMSWFRTAALNGHAAAQYNLGIALKNVGASAEADYWFNKAFANGFQEHGMLQQLQALWNGIWHTDLRRFFLGAAGPS